MAGNSKFPHLVSSVENFINEEEGSISRNKVLAIGSLMLVMSLLMATDVSAAHSSHRSHSSHSSHRSHSSHSSGSHSSHASHYSSSHSNSSASSHSNTAGIPTLEFTKPELYNIAAVRKNLTGAEYYYASLFDSTKLKK